MSTWSSHRRPRIRTLSSFNLFIFVHTVLQRKKHVQISLLGCRAWSVGDQVLNIKNVFCTLKKHTGNLCEDGSPPKTKPGSCHPPPDRATASAVLQGLVVLTGANCTEVIRKTLEPLQQQQFYLTSKKLTNYRLNPLKLLARNPFCERCKSTEHVDFI